LTVTGVGPNKAVQSRPRSGVCKRRGGRGPTRGTTMAHVATRSWRRWCELDRMASKRATLSKLQYNL